MGKLPRSQLIKKLHAIDEAFTDLLRDRECLQAKIGEIAEAKALEKQINKLIESIHSLNYRSFLEKRHRDISEGTLTLTVNDYFQFWTDMHDKDEIVWFKLISRLLPSYWDEPEMQLYQKRQTQQIESISRKAESSDYRKEALKLARNNDVEDMLRKCRERYQAEKVPTTLIQARCKAFLENNFERIFLLSPFLNSSLNQPRGPDLKERQADYVAKLAGIIKTQIEGGICVRVASMSINETSTFERPQDFGVAVTSQGDIFGMFCDVDIYGNPQGGVVIVDPVKIQHYLDCYLRIRGKTDSVPVKLGEDEIRDTLAEALQAPPVDISDPEIYGNRCHMCLKRAEEVVRSGAWKSETSPLRTWYEIVDAENKALCNVLMKLDVRGEILEIGCGPGRLLRIITELIRDRKIHSTVQIVGYEQNPEIANSCRDAFRSEPNVRIFQHFLGFKDGSLAGIRPADAGRYSLILAMSNLVGWQEDKEVEWLDNVVREGLTDGGTLFLTVYKRGFELERARMYKAAGDIIEIASDKDAYPGDIVLVVDAFHSEKHRSKAYEEEDLKKVLEAVKSRVAISYKLFPVGRYMWGALITRVSEGTVMSRIATN